jgi:hypothetical protein
VRWRRDSAPPQRADPAIARIGYAAWPFEEAESRRSRRPSAAPAAPAVVAALGMMQVMM